jgi:predicted dinucleotide-binding enzyme
MLDERRSPLVPKSKHQLLEKHIMRIGILGTGRMGSTLGRLWVQVGHQVCFGSRTPQKAQLLAESIGPTSTGGSYADAAAFGDVVLLATRWAGVPEALQAAGALTDKVLIDCTLPIVNREKAIDGNTSGAEEIAHLAPGAKVVKAFNTIHYEHFGAARFETPITAFYCGDDPAAKAITAELAADLGVEPMDAGPLFLAGFLEDMGLLYIYLSFAQGYGPTIAFKLLHDGSDT